MNRKRVLVLLPVVLFWLLLTGTVGQQQGFGSEGQAAQPQPAASGSSEAPGEIAGDLGVKKYLLGPGDLLMLRVYGEPQFDGPLVVNDEGNIEVPFIDKAVPARCRTDREVRQDVLDALSKYLKKPQVSLVLTEARSHPPAVVFGAVRSAQRVKMQRKAHLLELLAYSGGVTEQAGGLIQVFHTEPVMCPDAEDEPELSATTKDQKTTDDVFHVPFNNYSLADLKLGKPGANPLVRPGDIIIVQEASPVYVTGAVVSPQGLYLRDQLSLRRAIAMVGGIRKDAKPSEIRIYRSKVGSLEPEIIKADYSAIKKNEKPDVALQPFDIVEVPGSTVNKQTLLQGLLGSGLGSIASFGAALPYRVLY